MVAREFVPERMPRAGYKNSAVRKSAIEQHLARLNQIPKTTARGKPARLETEIDNALQSLVGTSFTHASKPNIAMLYDVSSIPMKLETEIRDALMKIIQSE